MPTFPDPTWALPMNGAFNFNGTSSLSFGLICQTVSKPINPPPKIRETSLATRDGTLMLNVVKYDLFDVVIKIQFLGESFSEMYTRLHNIGLWLNGAKNWANLTFEGESGVYKAMVRDSVTISDFQQFHQPFVVADITFKCTPNGARTTW
jgi:predicted phage tail component-like protein